MPACSNPLLTPSDIRLKLEAINLTARHPAARAHSAPALSGVSLRIRSAEQIAVIGPSGAGKTTLMHALACALPPAAGRLTIDNQDPWSLSRPALQRMRGKLFLAPQVPPLPPRQRVVTSVLAGNLPAMGLWRSLRSLFYPVDIAGAHIALEHFDLGEKLFDRVDRLSGGERQRVGLARLLMAPASLWLVDEPLSALDPTRARQAMDTLLQQARERKVTLIATMHQVDLALARFERIIGLRDGAVGFDLPSERVTQEHLARLYVQHEDELTAAEQMPEASPQDGPQPVVLHCR